MTSLPERAFSKALSGLLEKVGGEAACRGTEKGVRLKNIYMGNLNLCRSTVLY